MHTEKKFIACINIIPYAKSIYRWDKDILDKKRGWGE